VGFGKPVIWISPSSNLLEWGQHYCLIRPREYEWERIRIVRPEMDHETAGVFPNVVFSNGLIERAKGEIYLYYVACGDTTHLVITNREKLLADLDI
jgi:predicted GH43/DUF377 family glycosyl hydrolase